MDAKYLNGFVLVRGAHKFAYSGSPAECRAVLVKMFAQVWILPPGAWGAAVLSVGAL